MDLFSIFHSPKSDRPIATLLIVHGMMEHSGRYDHFVNHLTSQNIAVVTFDHPGHGKTATDKNELGFFSAKAPVELLLRQTSRLAGMLASKYPDTPHFILGHSMGSFITRCLLQRESSRFKGAILMGTGGKMAGAHVGKLILKILNVVAPKHRSTIINRAFHWMNNRHFTR